MTLKVISQQLSQRFTQQASKLGPLSAALVFFVGFILFFGLSRLLLTLSHISEVNAVEGALRLFPVGLRMDSIILCALVFIPASLSLLLPNIGKRYWQAGVAFLFGVFSFFLIYFEAVTYTFISVYNARPNHLFVEYMAHPDAVIDILWHSYKLEFFFGLLIMILGAIWVTRLTYRLMSNAKVWPYWQRAVIAPFIIALLILGARSSITDSPANLGTAAFSEDTLVNELALNSSYAVAYATYNRLTQEQDLASRYGQMVPEEIIRRVRRQTQIPLTAFDDDRLPLAHTQTPATQLKQPRNLVIILAESLSAEFIGTLGGLPLSPQFDALSQNGILFSKLFATGKRTNRGVESVITGALPIPLISAIKLRLAQSDFFTLPQLLKTHGYRTSFLYGGDANFDNMRRFLSYNGVDQFIEGADIDKAQFRNHWGVSDGDTFTTANALFRDSAQTGQPFASVILTLSNHEPFDYPEGGFELYEQPPFTQNNVAKYADHALGEFFTQARKEDYFNNTVFLVVADHGIEIQARGLIPAAKYHVPALIIAPDAKPQRINTLASQIDLPPTVLGLLGITTRHPMPGRDLLNLPPDTPGRAIYHLGSTYAYQVEDQVVIQTPDRPARQYYLNKGVLTASPLDPELAQDALAHLLLPDLLHREQRYQLPIQTQHDIPP